MKKFAIYILIICWALSAKAFLPGKYGWNEPRNCRDINSPADEFAPVWNDTDASLIFNSDREGVSKFYTAAPDSFCFTGIHALGRLLNAPAQNRSYMSFLNPDEAYISAFRMAGGRAQLNIFRTIRQKGMWSRPMLVEDLASDYFTAHPAISPDGNLIIFSSTRDSEYGDSDLWMARRLDDVSWDIPVRLDEISSPGDYITPFLASGDTL
ncbi:MAG: TolB family protein, partial [Bacteroidota bacterium]